MYTLAFDTTGRQCAIILQQDGKEIARFCEYMDFGQAEVLIPQIQKILIAQKLSFAEIGLLAVCVGPGSFTGVRASIAAARAFGMACPQLTVTGVSAFEAYSLALEQSERAEINAVLIETKRADFYVQLFDDKLNKLGNAEAASYEEIIPLLRHHKVSLIGDGVERFLAHPSGLSLHAIKMMEALPIEYLAAAAQKHYHDKKIDFPKPLYLRAPDVAAPKAG